MDLSTAVWPLKTAFGLADTGSYVITPRRHLGF